MISVHLRFNSAARYRALDCVLCSYLPYVSVTFSPAFKTPHFPLERYLQL